MRNWIFWDESLLAAKSFDELLAYVAELRRARAHPELLRLARRFVERGRGIDTIRLFTPDEIRLALEEIERSARSLQFVDPIRIRMYKRYLSEGKPGDDGGSRLLRDAPATRAD